MSFEPERPARPVTSMSLRAERLRQTMARAAGAKVEGDDPGLSKAPPVRDPALVNRFAIAGFAVGIVAVFVDVVYVPSVVALVFCVIGLRQASALEARGKAPFGRRRSKWGIGFALFGALTITYQLLSPLLFR